MVPPVTNQHPPKSLEQNQIEAILRKCYPGMSETILTHEEAKLRAAMVYEDMAAVNFPLRLGTTWPVQAAGYETIEIPSYPLDGIMYGPEADPSGEGKRDAAGPLLSCGEFIRLSKACKLGRELLTTNRWPSRFTVGLRDTQKHLSVIEEILWLGRWHSPENIEMTYKQNPSAGKDIDWRFTCCGQTINLEVKYRMRDWLGVVDGSHFSRNFDSYFSDVKGKFGPRPDGELNIVGITTFTPPDRGLQECTKRFLDKHAEIDAVIFWSIHDPEGKRPEIHARHPELIKMLFKWGGREDNLFCAPIRHLWRKREERRAMRPAEAMDAIPKMNADSKTGQQTNGLIQ
jgi:hypothetical protein